MARWIGSFLLILSLVVAGGCRRQVDYQAAIRASIDKHLNERSDLNMAAMEHEIKQVSVKGDQATALVEFRLKQGGTGMQLEYALQRQNGQWNVLSSQPAAGQNAHPAMDQPAPNAPSGSTQGSLPPFNELLNNPPASGSKPLPPGHPPIGDNNAPVHGSTGNKQPGGSQ